MLRLRELRLCLWGSCIIITPLHRNWHVTGV